MEFDLSKLKKRPAHPIETIAVGLSFSPKTEAILAEAKRLSASLGAKLILIHAGAKTKNKEKLLSDILFRQHIEEKELKIIWAQGDVVDILLKLCKLNIVDLLVIGALEKENILQYYLGSVARSVSRRAKCSVLLLTHPSVMPKPKQKILLNAVVGHPKTIHTLNTTLYLARHWMLDEITLVCEMHTPALAMTMAESSTAPEVTRIKKEITEEESAKLRQLLSECDAGNIKVNEKIIRGKTGYAVRQYATAKKADLLVINSPDTNLTLLDRIFTHDIEYILADLPCNVLIVHSRV